MVVDLRVPQAPGLCTLQHESVVPSLGGGDLCRSCVMLTGSFPLHETQFWHLCNGARESLPCPLCGCPELTLSVLQESVLLSWGRRQRGGPGHTPSTRWWMTAEDASCPSQAAVPMDRQQPLG